MANNKTGFNYYSLDTDRYLDIRIKRLKKIFSCSGIAIYDYILNEIYRDKGCFLEWDANSAFDVAEYFGIEESLVNEVVKYCGVVGLFNKGLLSSCGVLTSKSIQKRAIDLSFRSKRKVFIIPEKIRLTEQSTIPPEQSDIPPEQSDIPPEQSDIPVPNKLTNKVTNKSTQNARGFWIENTDKFKAYFLQNTDWQKSISESDIRFRDIKIVIPYMNDFATRLQTAGQFPIEINSAKNRFAGYLLRNFKNITDGAESHILSEEF